MPAEDEELDARFPDSLGQTIRNVFKRNWNYYQNVGKEWEEGAEWDKERAARLTRILGDADDFHAVTERYWKEDEQNRNSLVTLNGDSAFLKEDGTFQGGQRGFLLYVFTDMQLEKIYALDRGKAFNTIIGAYAAQGIRGKIANSIISNGDIRNGAYWENYEKRGDELTSAAIMRQLEAKQVFHPNSSLDQLRQGMQEVLGVNVSDDYIGWLYIENKINSQKMEPVLQTLIIGHAQKPATQQGLLPILDTNSSAQIQARIDSIYSAASEADMKEAIWNAFGIDASKVEVAAVWSQKINYQLIEVFINSLAEGFLKEQVGENFEVIFKKIQGEDEETIKGYFAILTSSDSKTAAIQEAMGSLGLASDEPTVTAVYTQIQYNYLITSPKIDPSIREILENHRSKGELRDILGTKTPEQIQAMVEAFYKAPTEGAMRQAFEAFSIVPTGEEVVFFQNKMIHYQGLEEFVQNLTGDFLPHFINSQRIKVVQKMHEKSDAENSELFKTLLNSDSTKEQIKAAMTAVGLTDNDLAVTTLFIQNQYNYLTQSEKIDHVLRNFMEQQSDEDKEALRDFLRDLSPEEIQWLVQDIYKATTKEQMKAALEAFALTPSGDQINAILEQMEYHQKLDSFIQKLPGSLQRVVNAQKDAVIRQMKEDEAGVIQGYFNVLTSPDSEKAEIEDAMGHLGLANDAPAVATFFTQIQINSKKIDISIRAILGDPTAKAWLEATLPTKTTADIQAMLGAIYTASTFDEMKSALEDFWLEPTNREVGSLLNKMQYYQMLNTFTQSLPQGFLQSFINNQRIEVVQKIHGKSADDIRVLFEELINPANDKNNIKNALVALGLKHKTNDIDSFFGHIQYKRIKDIHPSLEPLMIPKKGFITHLNTLSFVDINNAAATLVDSSKSKDEIAAALRTFQIPDVGNGVPSKLFGELQYKRILDYLAVSGGPLYTLWSTPALEQDIKDALKVFENPVDITQLIDTIKNGDDKLDFQNLMQFGFQQTHVNRLFGRKQLELVLANPATIPVGHPELEQQFRLPANHTEMKIALGALEDSNAVAAAFAGLYDATKDLAELQEAMEAVGLPLGVAGATENLDKLYAENKFEALRETISNDPIPSNFLPPLPTNATEVEVKNWLKSQLRKPFYYPFTEVNVDHISPANILALQTAINAQQTHHAAANIGPLLNTHMFPKPEDLQKLKGFISTLDPAIQSSLMANDQAQLKALLAAKKFREFIGILKTCGLEHSKANTDAFKNAYADLHAYNRNANLQNAALARTLASQGVYLKKDDIAEWNKKFTKMITPNGQKDLVESLKLNDMYRWDVKKQKGVKLSLAQKAELLDLAGPNMIGEVAKRNIVAERNHADNADLYRKLNDALLIPEQVGDVAVLHTLIRMDKSGDPAHRLNAADIDNILAAFDAPNYAEFCSPAAGDPSYLGIQALDKGCPNWKSTLTEEKFMVLKQRLKVQKVLNLGDYNEHRLLIEADQEALKKQEQDLGGETRAFYRTHGKGKYDTLAIDQKTLQKLGAMRDIRWLDPQFQATSKQYASLIKPRVEELKVLCALMLPAYRRDRNDIQKRLDRLPTVEEAEACNEPPPARLKYTPAQIKQLKEHRQHLIKRLDFLDGEIKKYQKADQVINGDPAVADKDSFQAMGLEKCIKRAETGKFIKVVGTSWKCESVSAVDMAAELSAIKAGEPLPASASTAITSYVPALNKGIDPMVAIGHGVVAPASRPRITPKYVDVPVLATPGPYRITVGENRADLGFFYLDEKKDGSATTVKAGQFPNTGPERVNYAMLQAKFLLENTPPGKTPKLEIFGGSREEREFLWTALMLLSDTKGMKFGRKDIDLGGDKDFSNKWGNIDKDGAVYKVFKEGANWNTVVVNQDAMQQFADKRAAALKTFAGYEVDKDEKLVGSVKKGDVTKVLNPTTQSKERLSSAKLAFMESNKTALADKAAKEEKEERLNPKPRDYTPP